MKAEFQLLFACAKERHSEADQTAIRRLLGDGTDWATLAHIANEHGLAGLVGHSLTQIAPDMVPQEIQDAFRTNLDRTRDAHSKAIKDVLEILGAWANTGLSAISFRGPLLTLQAYKDPGFRRITEWDFLIRDSEKGHALRILRELGYSRKSQLTAGQREMLNRISGQEVVFHPETSTSIALRTRLTPLSMALEPDYAALWARAQPATVNGQRIIALGPEDLLQCLVLDGAGNMWRDLETACDLAALIAARPNLDWAALSERTRAQGCFRSLVLAAQLAHEVFGAGIPPFVAAHTKRTARAIAKIVHRWQQDPGGGATDRGFSLDRLRLHDSLAQRVRHRLRTFFLPSPYHISRIALPGRLNNLVVYGASKFVPHRAIHLLSRSFGALLGPATKLSAFRPFAKRTASAGVAAYECHVITLARLPQKYPDFLTTNARTGLEFTRFEGIDGKRLSRTDAINMGVIRANAVGYSEGMIGCGASHLSLWKHAKNNQQNILIFEDDAYCRWDLRHQLDELLGNLRNWDVILLGYNTSSVLDVRISEDCNLLGFFSSQHTPAQLEKFQKTTNNVVLMRLNNAFGSCAYLVSPQGAEKLIKTFPMDNRPVRIPALQAIKSGRTTFPCVTSDAILNTAYRDMNAYAVVPPLVIPLNDRATSTTIATTDVIG